MFSIKQNLKIKWKLFEDTELDLSTAINMYFECKFKISNIYSNISKYKYKYYLIQVNKSVQAIKVKSKAPTLTDWVFYFLQYSLEFLN